MEAVEHRMICFYVRKNKDKTILNINQIYPGQTKINYAICMNDEGPFSHSQTKTIGFIELI